MVPTTQAAMPPSCSTFTGEELSQAKKKVLHLCSRGPFSCAQLSATLWTVALQGFTIRGFSRWEYWSVLDNTGCHILLEHYISCGPSCQLPWVADAARTPVTQEAAPPPHLALSGTNPSSPGQPQEQTPKDDSHAEVEIKPQSKPGGSVAKEENPKHSHQLYKLQIKSTQSTSQTLCPRNI